MKILLVGSSKQHSLANIYRFFLTSLGYEAEVIDLWNTYKKNILARNAVFHRLFWRILSQASQKKLADKVGRFKPDIILVFKGWLVSPNILKEIKNKFGNIILSNLNPDNPFNTWHHSNSNSWIRHSIPLYDIYFIWGKFLMEKLYDHGAKNVEYLPFGYDSSLHYPINVSEEEKKKYGADIAFIGSWDEEREEWLSHLVNYDLKIWGNHWEKANKEIREKWQKKAIFGEEFSKVCNSSKIVINLIRKQNRPAHNMRTFEVPACKGFMLSHRTQEAVDFFEENKEAAYFDSLVELKKKIEYYVKNDKERKKIADAGYDRLKRSNYSYEDRVKQVLKYFEQL